MDRVNAGKHPIKQIWLGRADWLRSLDFTVRPRVFGRHFGRIGFVFHFCVVVLVARLAELGSFCSRAPFGAEVRRRKSGAVISAPNPIQVASPCPLDPKWRIIVVCLHRCCPVESDSTGRFRFTSCSRSGGKAGNLASLRGSSSERLYIQDVSGLQNLYTEPRRKLVGIRRKAFLEKS